jgi:hypothetical protein
LPQHKLELVGHSGEVGSRNWFNIGVNINDYEPDISPHVRISLRPRRAEYQTFVVVFAQRTQY